jgi:DNA/RNA endonuclease YhcR with UshA esterase domain
VRVRGTIRSLREPREGSRAPWSLEIEDADGRATVIFFRDVFDALPDASALRAGAEVSARAVAGTYRGQRQLTVSRAPDLVFVPSAPGADPGARVSPPPAASPEPERPLLTVGQALAGPVGQVARVAGEVQSVRRPREGSRAPWMVVLVDGLNELTIVYWSKVADALGDRTPAPGDRIEASGRLEEYRGKPQLRVERAGDLRRPEPAPRFEPAPDPPPDPAGAAAEAIRPIAGLTLERTGAMAAVRGTLGAPRPIRGGAVFPLTGADGGEIDVLLWSNRVGAATIGGLRSGATLRVEGAIGDYRGRRQIVPADGAAVRAEEGAAP